MKAVKFTEMSSLEWQEAYASVKNAINESIKVCPSDCVSSYKDMELDTYWDSLSVISRYVLIEDEEDEEGLKEMFEEARDAAWESFIQDICECDDDCDEVDEEPKTLKFIAFDCYGEDAHGAISEDYSTLFYDVIGNGGTTRQFAKYFGFAVYDNHEAEQLEVYKA